MSLARLQDWMEASGVGAACLTDPLSIAYLTGFCSDPHERLMALAVTGNRALLLVPGLEVASAEAATGGLPVRGWRDGEDPYAILAGALAAPGGLAVEKRHLTLAAWEELEERLPGTVPLDAGPQLRAMRARKSPREIELLELAAGATDRIVAAILAGLREGMSELEVASRLAQLIAAERCRPSFESIVQSGPNSAQPHLRPTERRLARGDLVLLDFGAAWAGYRADITRMACVGPAGDRELEMHALVLRAHDAAAAAVRPGAKVGEVDEAARAVIRQAGYGEWFPHRVGHGLGLDAHEEPSLDPGSAAILEAGMVITVEPGVYLPGWGGIRIEDDLLVTEAGCRLLTRAGRELAEIPDR